MRLFLLGLKLLDLIDQCGELTLTIVSARDGGLDEFFTLCDVFGLLFCFFLGEELAILISEAKFASVSDQLGYDGLESARMLISKSVQRESLNLTNSWLQLGRDSRSIDLCELGVVGVLEGGFGCFCLGEC